MTRLYHFWSSPQSQRGRLALGYKAAAWEDVPLDYDDDETFFELGIARQVPVLELDDGTLMTDSVDILERIDTLFPSGAPLREERIDDAAWQALLDWRRKVDEILERLYAPVRPAYRDVAGDDTTLAAYKTEVEQRFAMSLEALANDRYAGYEQLSRITRLPELARHLAHRQFYMGAISIADMVLCADLYPLQYLDGIALPIDLMYYLRRVTDACQVSPEEGLLSQ